MPPLVEFNLRASSASWSPRDDVTSACRATRSRERRTPRRRVPLLILLGRPLPFEDQVFPHRSDVIVHNRSAAIEGSNSGRRLPPVFRRETLTRQRSNRSYKTVTRRTESVRGRVTLTLRGHPGAKKPRAT